MSHFLQSSAAQQYQHVHINDENGGRPLLGRNQIQFMTPSVIKAKQMHLSIESSKFSKVSETNFKKALSQRNPSIDESNNEIQNLLRMNAEFNRHQLELEDGNTLNLADSHLFKSARPSIINRGNLKSPVSRLNNHFSSSDVSRIKQRMKTIHDNPSQHIASLVQKHNRLSSEVSLREFRVSSSQREDNINNRIRNDIQEFGRNQAVQQGSQKLTTVFNEAWQQNDLNHHLNKAKIRGRNTGSQRVNSVQSHFLPIISDARQSDVRSSNQRNVISGAQDCVSDHNATSSRKQHDRRNNNSNLSLLENDFLANDLISEKRLEIQAILRKRQRKAAMMSHLSKHDSEGKPTLAGNNNHQSSFLPEISPKKPHQTIGVDQDLAETEIEGKHLLGKTSLHQEIPSNLIDSKPPTFIEYLDYDDEEMEVKKGKETNVMTKTKQIEEPYLETKRRAERDRKNKKERTTAIPPQKQKDLKKASPQKDTSQQTFDALKLDKLQHSVQSEEVANVNQHGDLGEEEETKEFNLSEGGLSNQILTAEEQKHTQSIHNSPIILIKDFAATAITSRRPSQELDQQVQGTIKNYSQAVLPKGKQSSSENQSTALSFRPMKQKVKRFDTISDKSKMSVKIDPAILTKFSKFDSIMSEDQLQRIQLIINRRKRTPKETTQLELTIDKFLQDLETKVEAIGNADKTPLTNNSVDWETRRLNSLNSALELFSEYVEASVGSPIRRQGVKRLGTIKNTSFTKSAALETTYEANESEEDKQSNLRRAGGGGLQQVDEQEDDESGSEASYFFQQVSPADIHDNKHSKNLRMLAKEEQEIGPQVMNRVNVFLDEIKELTGVDFEVGDQKNKMGSTGDSNAFEFEKNKNTSQNEMFKVVENYGLELKQQIAFYQFCKLAKEARYSESAGDNIKVQFYYECEKARHMAVPILKKMMDGQLLIRDTKLNTGLAKGLQLNLMTKHDMLNKLYLDDTGLDGYALAHIVAGLNYQENFQSLIIQGNSVNEQVIEQLAPLLKRKMPCNLKELHFIHSKVKWQATNELFLSMRNNFNLRKLSLVSASLNEISMKNFIPLLRTSKSLAYLDISWNSLFQNQMKELLEVLSTNRKLQFLNLSWNNIQDTKSTEEDEEEMLTLLGKIIKYNKNIQHIDLTGCKLKNLIVNGLGTCLRRSRSLLCLHLSANPGNKNNRDYLKERIRCRENENIERFTRIQTKVREIIESQNERGKTFNGLKKKVDRSFNFNIKQRSDPIKQSKQDELIFQRILGHKEDIPGSGQWYETSQNAVGNSQHYKNHCWICDHHVYTFIIWSRGMAYRINPILNRQKTQVIRYEIDNEFGEGEVNDHFFTNGSLKYSKLEDKVPYIAASFTGWRYRKMTSLEEFCQKLDKEGIYSPFELAEQFGKIKRTTKSESQCSDKEKSWVEYYRIQERLRLIYTWRKTFLKGLSYKRPFIENGHLFYHMPSEDGTLPPELRYEQNYFQDSSEEIDTEQELQKQEELLLKEDEAKKKKKNLTKEEKEEQKRREEELRKDPFAVIPDESKFDKIFIMPFFCKPGKHHYLIKYKDTDEPNQAQILKGINKQEKRYRREKEGKKVSKPFNKNKYKELKLEIQPECFFYSCDIAERDEEIPLFSKEMKSKTEVHAFTKETSVFKAWREDTTQCLQHACDDDISKVKCYRFIKSEEDLANTLSVLKTYYAKLKKIFLHIASGSSFPGITVLDIGDFAIKAKIQDNVISISTLDRLFIAATVKVETSSDSQKTNSLSRFEFLEIIVRIANTKYVETKICQTYAQATEKLITEVILPNFVCEPWQEFRDEYLWTIEVNDVLEANLKNLQTVYNTYLSPVHKFLDMQDCIKICLHTSNINVSEKDIAFSYGMSKMTVVNEQKQHIQYFQMQFVEFLEFIGRVAHYKFKGVHAEEDNMPLAQQIEVVLDEMLPAYGLKRNDVNIELEEISESDDDY